MPDPEVTWTNAKIQMEVGHDPQHPHLSRILIDGRDVSYQIRKVEFIAEGGQTTDVRVTYASPHVTVEGSVSMSEGGPVPDEVAHHG